MDKEMGFSIIKDNIIYSAGSELIRFTVLQNIESTALTSLKTFW